MPDRTSCPVCSHPGFEPLFLAPFPEYGNDGHRAYPLGATPPVSCWRIVRCGECGVGYPNPYPSADEIEDFYASQLEPNEYEMKYYVEVSQHERDHWAQFARRVTDLKAGPGKLLEVGCAAGWLLSGARAVGWDVTGLEASPKFAEYARGKQGLNVLTGTLTDPEAMEAVRQSGPFDVVVMTDVLEHLHDPVGDLKVMRDLLAPGGRLVIATLDFGSRSARRYGLAWRQIVVSHIVYWTRPSMRRALSEAGLRVVEFDTFPSWSPDRRERRRAKARAVGKYAAREVLTRTYMPLAKRSAGVRRAPGFLTRGRLAHDELANKIGDQPTLGDVMLVVAEA